MFPGMMPSQMPLLGDKISYQIRMRLAASEARKIFYKIPKVWVRAVWILTD